MIEIQNLKQEEIMTNQKMKIIIDCKCGEKNETSTVYDFLVCRQCNKTHIVPKAVAVVSAEVANWLDPSGSLQRAGLMRLN